MTNIRSIDLNLLTVLQALLAEESVSRAAEVVSLSQPATSQALGRLRALFQDKLLERREGRLRRTAFATRLMPRLNAAIQSTKAVFAPEADFDPAQMKGRLTLAATDYVSGLLLPGFLRALKAAAPALDLRIVPTDRIAVGDTLRSGRADLALGVFGPSTTGFWTEQLFEDDFVIVAHQGHPILAAETLAPRDMTGFEWALVSSSGDPVGQVDDALRPLGLTRRVLLTVPNFLHAPQIVAETGLVIALGRRFSKMAAAHWPLGLRELPLPVAGFTANMMWLAQRDGDPVLGWIRSLLRSSV